MAFNSLFIQKSWNKIIRLRDGWNGITRAIGVKEVKSFTDLLLLFFRQPLWTALVLVSSCSPNSLAKTLLPTKDSRRNRVRTSKPHLHLDISSSKPLSFENIFITACIFMFASLKWKQKYLKLWKVRKTLHTSHQRIKGNKDTKWTPPKKHTHTHTHSFLQYWEYLQSAHHGCWSWNLNNPQYEAKPPLWQHSSSRSKPQTQDNFE